MSRWSLPIAYIYSFLLLPYSTSISGMNFICCSICA